MKRDWNALLEILGDGLLMAFGLVLLYQFITIAMFGWYGREPNTPVLYTEVGMAAFILLIGINRFINDLKNKGG
jgi:hypothetical protein